MTCIVLLQGSRKSWVHICTYLCTQVQTLNIVISRAGNIYWLKEIQRPRIDPHRSTSLFRRVLSARLGALPDLDLPGRSLLHGQHNAPVHNLRGPLFVAALPDEIRTEQNAAESHPQNCIRLASEHRHEPALELDVLEGESLLQRTRLFIT